ncbi:ATP-binding protein [Niallia sp. 01092]|uniref:ATP-binding protein n=1 Tax=unclassified Niallia TaxID=2837522 RepID=UPI003FD61B98
MKDIQIVPFNQKENIIIAADNCGAIGMKAEDIVQASYETVAYYSFRVAVMECIAAGGSPFSVILQNFSGEDAWQKLLAGINKGIVELNLSEELAITGSTESNFSLKQSAVGVTVLGKSSSENEYSFQNSKIAVIGSPLVGNEVVEEEDKIAPLSLFYTLAKKNKYKLQPVGSKGILYELSVLLNESVKGRIDCSLDIKKSSGPSTCFLVEYEECEEEELQSITSTFFHEISYQFA